jgi:tetratricopeptide (TPR) repeat protein
MIRRSGVRRWFWRKVFFSVIVILAAALLASAQETRSQAQPNPPVEKGATAADVVTQIPPAPTDGLGEAIALARNGDFDAAIQKYQQFLVEKPKSPDGYAGLSRCYLEKELIGQAYDTAMKGVQIHDAWPIRVALGEVYFRQGKIPEAEKEWIDVLKAGYPAARAYLGLARVRWAIGLNKTAKTMIDKAYELDANDPEIRSRWIGTLPPADRTVQYEKDVADPLTPKEDREKAQRYLSRVQDQEKEQRRPCRLVSKVTATQTPLVQLLMDPQHLRGYGLTVEINGTRANILLDTGASGIVVKRHIAERAGLTKISEGKIWGVGDKGPRDSYIGTANSVRIGDLEFQDCPVEVMESRSVAGEDGLIGADVFEDFLVDLDFPDVKLKLSQLPKRPGEMERPLALKNDQEGFASDDPAVPSTAEAGATGNATQRTGPQDRYIAPEMQSFTHVYRFGHELLIPTKVGDVAGKLFLLDTGAITNSISPAAAREVTKLHGDSEMTVKGLSGSVKNVYSANKAVLQFGHLRQENQDMLSFDTTRISENTGTEVSGFLGFVLLRFLDIKIDYRDRLVDFSYDAARFGR